MITNFKKTDYQHQTPGKREKQRYYEINYSSNCKSKIL